MGHGGVAGVQDVTVQAQKRARGIFYGWWIVTAGSVLQALQGGFLFHGFTAYFVFLQRDFGWSRTVLSGGYSLTRVESAFLGPLQGWLIDRFGPRGVTIIGLIAFGLGFILFSRVNSLAAFYFAFLFVAIGASLGGVLAITTSLVNWFRRKRAMAMGITMSGMAVGGLVLVPVLAWSMTTFGWRDTALASGVAIWLLGIPSALFLRHRPGDYGYLTDGDSPPLDGADSEVGMLGEPNGAGLSTAEFNFSAREAMRTPAFWLLGMGHGSALLAVPAVSVHLIPHIVDQVEMSVRGAAGIVSLLMGILIAGQLGGGYIGDRVSKRLIIIGCMFGHAVGLWFLAYATSVPQLILFALFHGSA